MGDARPLDALANDRPAQRSKPDPGDVAGTVAASPGNPSPMPHSQLSTPHSL
jgi:hypothetical protein